MKKKPKVSNVLIGSALQGIDIEMQQTNGPSFGIHIFEGHVESTLETFSLKSTRASKC
jgi:hypothetical protein